MKMKGKILTTFILTLFAFNMNTAKALENTTSISLDNLPDTIETEMLSKDVWDTEHNIMIEELEEKIKQQVVGATYDGIQNDYSISIYFDNSDINQYLTDISKSIIEIRKNGQIYAQKEVALTYTDANWNLEDKKFIEEQFKDINELTDDLIVDVSNKEKIDDFLLREFEKIMPDNTIKISKLMVTKASWGWPELYARADFLLSKNDVSYYIASGVFFAEPGIIVPNEIADTEEAFIEYALPKINERMYWLSPEEYTLCKGEGEDVYTIKFYDDETTIDVIIIKNNIKLINDRTNVKLTSDNYVIPSDTILDVEEINDSEFITKIKNILSNVKNIKLYDITLLSNGNKIQPNGKVKITLPIPSDMDKSSLVVYRILENNEKIEYSVVVEGDYATFETDHFSIYGIADIFEEEQNRKLDDEPKTGKNNYVGVAGLLSVLSLLGMIVIKFRK